jgi:integrase
MPKKLDRTNTPGIFRRHTKACDRNGRCECSYVVVWTHRGRQSTETFRTYAEAREAKGGRDAGDKRPTSRVTFADYFAEWIESYAGRTARGFSETTRPEYRRPIEQHALPKWKRWKLAEVEPADVRDLFGEMRRDGKSTSAIKKLRAALSAMFATAVEDGAIRLNPVSGVRVPAAPSDELDEPAKALTRAELALLLVALPEQWRLFHEFLAHTGLRIGEAVGLTWQHVELGRRPRVKVRDQVYRGKRRRLKSRDGRRDIPLSPEMAKRLTEHRRDTYGGDEAPLFPSMVGTPLDPSRVTARVLKPAARSIGLGWVSFHSLRHTCASLLFEAGRNVKQVQEWLGHADPAFTLRTYVHLMDDGVGDAAFLDEAVRVKLGSIERPQTAANGVPVGAAETADSGKKAEHQQTAAAPGSDS